MWFGFALLSGFLVFIIWDGHRLRQTKPDPIPRNVMRKGYVPRGLIHWKAWLGMSLVAAVLAAMEWKNPSTPPFAGPGRWLEDLAYRAVGERAVFILLLLSCVGSACYGFILRQRTKSEVSGDE